MSEPILLSWTMTTRADPAAAWAVLSDTDRLNRLAGLSFEFTEPAVGEAFSRGTGHQRHLGLSLRWQERPVEFTEGSDLKIERDYENGPVSRVVNTLQLEPVGSGTRIQYQVRVWPRSVLLRPAVMADVRLTVRPGLSRALGSLFEALEGAADAPDLKPPPLGAQAERLLTAGLRGLVDAELAAHLGAHLRGASLTEQSRMRPLALARRWRIAPQRLTAGLLEAEAAGLLTLCWEMLCPSCRVSVDTPRTVSLRRRQAHCGSCDLRYDASIVDSIALVFRPSPEIRRTLGSPRCLSSPARMPHVLWQRNLSPRAEETWVVDLPPGQYRLRSVPDLDVVTLIVHPDATRREQVILAGPRALGPPIGRLAPGRVTLHVRSKLDRPMTLTIERPWQEPEQLSVGDLLAWPDVAARLPADALEPGVEVAPFEGLALVVQLARGGAEGERLVAEALRAAGARALQISTGWVMATLPDGDALQRACEAMQGALWLSAAVGYGLVIELAAGGERMAAGNLMQALVGRAADAAPGCVLALERHRWPIGVTPAAFGVPPFEAEWNSDDLRIELDETAERLPAMLAGPPLGPGALVDSRFKLAEKVGSGGFGIVFAALDLHTGEEVVVKLLRDTCAGEPEVVQRFFDEGLLAARLSGRHVVRVREWGLAEDGRLFIAMDRLHGRELGDLLRDGGTLSTERVLRLAADAAAGLAEAHAHGLVHRDIKPANLFVVGENTPAEHVKIIDFGIALDRTGEVRNIDRSGIIIGTPNFVSPEQVLGRTLDGRSDLYSLGLVLHVCLAGSLPFGGDNLMALVYARMTEALPPLDMRCAERLPPGLSNIVDSMVSLEPANRPETADAVAAALRGVLAALA